MAELRFGFSWHFLFGHTVLYGISALAKFNSTFISTYFIKKYCCKWLSIIYNNGPDYDQKENFKILDIYYGKWRPKVEKRPEKMAPFFLRYLIGSFFMHLKATKLYETFWGSRSYLKPDCWTKKMTKSLLSKALGLWPWFWPLLPFLRLRGQKSKE